MEKWNHLAGVWCFKREGFDSVDEGAFARKDLEKIFQKYDCPDFKWINPQDIEVSQWVRMKCILGCSTYGKKVFRVQARVEDPDKRSEWNAAVNSALLKVEREVFLKGFPNLLIV